MRKSQNGATETLLADANYLSDFVKKKEYLHGHEKGHLKARCPKLKGKRCTHSGMVCELYGQMGHTKAVCWEDPKNTDHRLEIGCLG